MSEKDSFFLNLNKPPGVTSFDCIRSLRKILGMKKMGHMGTLDPGAGGVLPIAIGRATRLIEHVGEGRKVYQAVFRIGITTSTDDSEGEVMETADYTAITMNRFEETLSRFRGKILQSPPSVSAIKIDGKRAYKSAFEGNPMDIPPRQVEVYEISITSWAPPLVGVEMTAGPGTYVRSIARDAGRILGCGGIVEKLLRTYSEPFHIDKSHTLQDLEERVRYGNLREILLSPLEILDRNRMALVKSADVINRILNGNPIAVSQLENPGRALENPGVVFLITTEGSVLSVAGYDREADQIRPIKVFKD